MDPNSAIMQEQILGPILPILVVDTYDEAMELANSMPTPPAAYGFSERRRIRRDFMHRINAGAAVMNATVLASFFAGPAPQCHRRSGLWYLGRLRKFPTLLAIPHPPL